ncbi:unnamed protein product [Sphenostylis stenocarpa]|uniref:Uncharacterized protein n=1 Tax=Sphenostylis stenocarpa TaxID=92480 RepID=A0AA86S4Y0_9FABA|nr:unnamed protein product [Sphenostylis stenocarpa]
MEHTESLALLMLYKKASFIVAPVNEKVKFILIRHFKFLLSYAGDYEKGDLVGKKNMRFTFSHPSPLGKKKCLDEFGSCRPIQQSLNCSRNQDHIGLSCND